MVEQVFAIPGLGRLILGAIAERNYPLMQATILVVTLAASWSSTSSSTCSTVCHRSAGAGMTMPALRRHPLLAFAVALVARAGCSSALVAAGSRPTIRWRRTCMARLKGPSAAHWLGTDQFGRDILSRIIYGCARLAWRVCVAAVGAALLVGGTLGLVAAYYRGWTTASSMRVMDVLFAFPVMLLAIGIIAVLGPRSSSTAAVGHRHRLHADLRPAPARPGPRRLRERLRCRRPRHRRLRRAHPLPPRPAQPDVSVMLVQTSLLLSAAILVEASLSFLGLGTQPPTPSLGLMLSEGRNVLLLSPWSAVFPGLAILFLSFQFPFFFEKKKKGAPLTTVLLYEKLLEKIENLHDDIGLLIPPIQYIPARTGIMDSPDGPQRIPGRPMNPRQSSRKWAMEHDGITRTGKSSETLVHRSR